MLKTIARPRPELSHRANGADAGVAPRSGEGGVPQRRRDSHARCARGEVVVDCALRLAREYPDRRIWAAAYSNDVFGYLPSARVLREGGYEGGDAMIYYGRPGPFTDAVEELIFREIRRLDEAGDRSR